MCPKSNSATLYFKRKLNIHNFTFYDLGTCDGHCFLWHEGEGTLEADEFSSIIYNFILELSGCVECVILWSDGCVYQNRNSILSSALRYSMINNLKPNLKCIHQKYLVNGHIQMELDSMHARIEKTSLKINIYIPDERMGVMKSSRRNSFNVRQLNHTFLKKFTSINFDKTGETNW